MRAPHKTADLDRPRIESALLDEVAECGYENASVAGVCRRAQTERRAFTRHFRDLQDGYLAVLEGLIEQSLAHLWADCTPRQSWRTQIRSSISGVLAYLDEDRRRARFMIVEINCAGERAQLIRDRVINSIAELIDQGRALRGDSDGLSRATAEAIAGGGFLHIRSAVERGDERLADLIPDLMFSAVLPYLGTTEAVRELAIAPSARFAAQGEGRVRQIARPRVEASGLSRR